MEKLIKLLPLLIVVLLIPAGSALAQTIDITPNTGVNNEYLDPSRAGVSVAGISDPTVIQYQDAEGNWSSYIPQGDCTATWYLGVGGCLDVEPPVNGWNVPGTYTVVYCANDSNPICDIGDIQLSATFVLTEFVPPPTPWPGVSTTTQEVFGSVGVDMQDFFATLTYAASTTIAISLGTITAFWPFWLGLALLTVIFFLLWAYMRSMRRRPIR